MKKFLNFKRFVFVLSLGLPIQGWALGPSLFSVRSGMVMGSVSGGGPQASYSLTTIPYLDAEWDLFFSSRMAVVLRTIMALDFATGNMRYSYSGTGQRFFLNAGGAFLSRSESGVTVTNSPKLNYFVGWDGGISNMVIQEVAELVVASTAFDGGATVGMNYFVADGVSINTGATVSYVFGFSSIAVSGLAMKFFVGASF